MTLAKRLKAMGSAKYQNDGDPRTSGPGFGVTFHEDALTEPLRWRPRRLRNLLDQHAFWTAVDIVRTAARTAIAAS